MAEADQPQLNCPKCGYSLRGIEPHGPELSMRCPECGNVTSIQSIVEEFERKRNELRRLPITVIVAVPLAVIVLVLINVVIHPAMLHSSKASVFPFAYGCLITGIIAFTLRGAPWQWRAVAIAIGGMVEAIASAYMGIRFGTLPMIVWCVAAHQITRRQGWT